MPLPSLEADAPPPYSPSPLTERGSDLLASTVAAQGGEEFLGRRFLRVTGDGEFTTPPQTGSITVPLSRFTLYIADGGRSRLEARGPGVSLLFVVRGHGEGGYLVLAGKRFPLPADQTDYLEPTEFLRRAARCDYPATPLLPGEAVAEDGTPLLRYRVLRDDGKASDLSVESGSRLLRKMTLTTPRGEMTVSLSDYRTVEGVPVFGALQLLENGASIYELRTVAASFEAPADRRAIDKLFE